MTAPTSEGLESPILLSIEGGIARVTLNRPDKLNSFTAAMHAALRAALDEVEAADGVRVLVLTGQGRGFCAGQDLSERQPAADGSPPDLGETVARDYAPLVRRLRRLPVPVLVGVNGVAAGAGANLALAGDLVVATASASFIQSFCRLGLIPDTGGTYWLPRLTGRARALGLSLLGDKLSAAQAAQWGLIWACVPDAEFPAHLDALAAQLAEAPTRGLVRTRELIDASLQHTLDEQLDLERDAMRALGASDDYAEGVAAFLAKRAPVFRGR